MSRITSLLTGFLQNAIYLLPAIAISLSVHELCHGYTAYRLGDPTAKSQGRLTLNPLAHMDPLGTLCLLLLGFGWAKPVPVNPMYFRDRRKGMALTSAAGPAANLVLAFFSLTAYILTLPLTGNPVGNYLSGFLIVLASINVGLAVFNMLPISPLDGSKILYALLPERSYFQLLSYERYVQPLLFLLLFTGLLDRPLIFLRSAIMGGMLTLLQPLISLIG